MKPDQIEVGKTYLMKRGVKDRLVIDILSYPAKDLIGEYREVVCEFASGKRKGVVEKVSLGWFAASARGEK